MRSVRARCKLLTPSSGNLQDPRIDVTGNGHVYVTYDVGDLKNGQQAGIEVVKSTDGGATFSRPVQILTYEPWEATDVSAVTGGANRDCGDFADACVSGYTFFRNDSSTDSSADQKDAAHEYLYLIYDASKPGTQAPTGTTYGTVNAGFCERFIPGYTTPNSVDVVAASPFPDSEEQG